MRLIVTKPTDYVELAKSHLVEKGFPVLAKIPAYDEKFHHAPSDITSLTSDELAEWFAKVTELANETEKSIGYHEAMLSVFQKEMARITAVDHYLNSKDEKTKYKMEAERYLNKSWLAAKEKADYYEALLALERPLFNSYTRILALLSREQSRRSDIIRTAGGY